MRGLSAAPKATASQSRCGGEARVSPASKPLTSSTSRRATGSTQRSPNPQRQPSVQSVSVGQSHAMPPASVAGWHTASAPQRQWSAQSPPEKAGATPASRRQGTSCPSSRW
ncbi:MAG: hypothetical protein IPJ65_27970 [Archangiaceae bacterium]|nr:hypothetical protein [Archangiaceae bacterium]